MPGSRGSPLEDPQPSVFAANDHRGGPDGEAECAGLSAPDWSRQVPIVQLAADLRRLRSGPAS